MLSRVAANGAHPGTAPGGKLPRAGGGVRMRGANGGAIPVAPGGKIQQDQALRLCRLVLHCVALDRAEVAAPWSRYEREANSLFWFRLALGLCSMLLLLPLLAVIALLIVRMVLRGEADAGGIILAAGFGTLCLFLVILLAAIRKFMADFVVPLQYLRGTGCFAAWREFLKLLAGHPGVFTLYLLFQLVLGLAIGIIIVMAMLLTCCLAFCVMIIPYVGTVLLLPVLVFKQSYPLYFLRQFGPGYNVFPPGAAAAPAAGLRPIGGA